VLPAIRPVCEVESKPPNALKLGPLIDSRTDISHTLRNQGPRTGVVAVLDVVKDSTGTPWTPRIIWDAFGGTSSRSNPHAVTTAEAVFLEA
jgi:hypothetical protein